MPVHASRGLAGQAPVRSLVLWFPDWPVTAWRWEDEQGEGKPREERQVEEHQGGEHQGEEQLGVAEAPVALVHAGAVVACSQGARAEGVRRGQRRRDAQSRCPHLQIVAADPVRDQRVFSPLVSRIEQFAPGVQIIRPGLCALQVRGPARYYGGEDAAACGILDVLAEEEGLTQARAGVADGLFTAQQAARATRADAPVHIVQAGQAASFLAPLPVSALEDADLAHLLARLGVHTLGAFAGLDPVRVQERFGPRGRRLQDLAAGADSRPLLARTPPPQLEQTVAFEPPLELASQVAFGVRTAADVFITDLAARGLVCTGVRVRLTGERGEHNERVWLHPGSFDASAVVDRVRWQLTEAQQGPGAGKGMLRSGVSAVRIEPESVEAASAHRPALFGSGPEERVHHALSRVQAMLGHRAVLTPVLAGGRWLTERQTLVPWGDRAEQALQRDRPWPGSLPAPLPAAVYAQPRIVEVLDSAGTAVDVDERGALSAAPARIVEAGRERAVLSWAGPWTVDERGWDASRARHAHRFQVVDAGQNAWLLVRENGHWAAEAKYD